MRRGASRPRRDAAVWLLGAALALLPPAWHWARTPAAIRRPATPVDLTHGAAARQWRFLASARGLIPPVAPFTVRAADRQEEMNLFMLALGLFPQLPPVPTSYWERPYPRHARAARFALALGCVGQEEEGWEVVSRLPDGCVLRRR